MREELGTEIVELDLLLRRAAAGFSYPRTPSYAASVTARLERADVTMDFMETMRRWWQRPALRAALATLGAVALVLGAVLAIPQSRTAVADLLGLSHVQVRPLTETDLPPALGPEDFALPVTAAVAQAKSSVPLRLPTYPNGIGGPDAVYLQILGADTVIIFVYEDEGFDLYQSRLRGFFGKGVPVATMAAEVAGVLAFWIQPGGHVAEYIDPGGMPVAESRRTVERAVLLWQEDGITYRLETFLSLEEAVRVAESLR